MQQFLSPSSNRRDDAFGGSEEARHEVIVPSFEIGRFAVTFEEYDLFCDATGNDESDDNRWGRGRRPAINVSWYDATAYAKWLSRQTGKPYRLPTEAEWEYAARAGTTGLYSFEGDINESLVSFHGHHGQTLEVGSLPPNPWGLHEVHGNVMEWVEAIESVEQRRRHRHGPIDPAHPLLEAFEDDGTGLEIDSVDGEQARFRKPTPRVGEHVAKRTHLALAILGRPQESLALGLGEILSRPLRVVELETGCRHRLPPLLITAATLGGDELEQRGLGLDLGRIGREL